MKYIGWYHCCILEGPSSCWVHVLHEVIHVFSLLTQSQVLRLLVLISFSEMFYIRNCLSISMLTSDLITQCCYTAMHVHPCLSLCTACLPVFFPSRCLLALSLFIGAVLFPSTCLFDLVSVFFFFWCLGGWGVCWSGDGCLFCVSFLFFLKKEKEKIHFYYPSLFICSMKWLDLYILI